MKKCRTWQTRLNLKLNIISLYFIFYAISISSSYCHLSPLMSCGRHHSDRGILRQLGQEIAKHLHLTGLHDFLGWENMGKQSLLTTTACRLVNKCKNHRFDHVC